jgi:hypothetical protein
MWPNMLYLMAIAFMPFDRVLGRNLGHFVPALVYNLSMLCSRCWRCGCARIRAAAAATCADGLDSCCLAGLHRPDLRVPLLSNGG